MESNKNIQCCFFGHRRIVQTEELKENLSKVIEELIKDKKVDTFLFGSKSQFDDLCYEIVTKLKDKYPHIKRIYVRAEYPYIDDEYKNYLLQIYDDTYYPEKIINAGKAVYVERNCEMIDSCDYCVVYLDEGYVSRNAKSGTKYAYDYAIKRCLKIVRCNGEVG